MGTVVKFGDWSAKYVVFCPLVPRRTRPAGPAGQVPAGRLRERRAAG
jgi:hypothetical protein